MNHVTLPQRTCSASVACSNFSVADVYIDIDTSSNVINCTPGMTTVSTPANFMIVAIANTAAPSTRFCSWIYTTPYFLTGGTFGIATADGLPVELMGFSIEDLEPADDEEPETEDPESD